MVAIGRGTTGGNARVLVRRRAWAFPFIRCCYYYYYYYCYKGRTRPLAYASPRRNPLISKVPIKGECRRDRCRAWLPPSYPSGKGPYNIIAFYLISSLPTTTALTPQTLCSPRRPIPLYRQPAAHQTNTNIYQTSSPWCTTVRANVFGTYT